MVDEPYHYVLFRWWNRVDVIKLLEEFNKDFDVKLKIPPFDENRISIHVDNLIELWVKADTLSAFLSNYRAVLFQKKKAPFTHRDMKLRKKVMKLYPRSRPTPLPWLVDSEPKFEVEKKSS